MPAGAFFACFAFTADFLTAAVFFAAGATVSVLLGLVFLALVAVTGDFAFLLLVDLTALVFALAGVFTVVSCLTGVAALVLFFKLGFAVVLRAAFVSTLAVFFLFEDFPFVELDFAFADTFTPAFTGAFVGVFADAFTFAAAFDFATGFAVVFDIVLDLVVPLALVALADFVAGCFAGLAAVFLTTAFLTTAFLTTGFLTTGFFAAVFFAAGVFDADWADTLVEDFGVVLGLDVTFFVVSLRFAAIIFPG